MEKRGEAGGEVVVQQKAEVGRQVGRQESACFRELPSPWFVGKHACCRWWSSMGVVCAVEILLLLVSTDLENIHFDSYASS